MTDVDSRPREAAALGEAGRKILGEIASEDYYDENLQAARVMFRAAESHISVWLRKRGADA